MTSTVSLSTSTVSLSTIPIAMTEPVFDPDHLAIEYGAGSFAKVEYEYRFAEYEYGSAAECRSMMCTDFGVAYLLCNSSNRTRTVRQAKSGGSFQLKGVEDGKCSFAM